jgi:hypothetical protein
MVAYFTVGVGVTMGMIFVRVMTGMEGEPALDDPGASHCTARGGSGRQRKLHVVPT